MELLGSKALPRAAVTLVLAIFSNGAERPLLPKR
jgi:hypothetical protein